MDILFLTILAGGAFAMGWLTARTIHGVARRRTEAEDMGRIVEDEFTRSIEDWGRRHER